MTGDTRQLELANLLLARLLGQLDDALAAESTKGTGRATRAQTDSEWQRSTGTRTVVA